MRHIEKAVEEYAELNPGKSIYIDIDPQEVSVKFTIQSDPVSQVGVNGLQCEDIMKYSLCLLQSLNEVFPCRENAISITKLQEAIMWQQERTRDRTRRNVEGKNEK